MKKTVSLNSGISNSKNEVRKYLNPQISSTFHQGCQCCPYGYHMDLDFPEFAKRISNSHQGLFQNEGNLYEQRQESCLTQLYGKPHDSKEACERCREPQHKLMQIRDRFNYISPMRLKDQCILHKIHSSNENEKFKSSTVPKDHFQNHSLSSKSFIISYEHLLSIKEQMSLSIKRVKDLELQSECCQELRQVIDSLTKENQILKRQLSEEIEQRETKLRLDANWRRLSDFPTKILPNLERLLHVKLPRIMGKSQTTAKSCQTMPHDILEDLFAKCATRNVGIIVRPQHNHFSQQVALLPRPNNWRESMATFVNWIEGIDNDLDKKVGLLFYRALVFFSKSHYTDSINILKEKMYGSLPTTYERSTSPLHGKDTPVICNCESTSLRSLTFCSSTNTDRNIKLGKVYKDQSRQIGSKSYICIESLRNRRRAKEGIDENLRRANMKTFIQLCNKQNVVANGSIEESRISKMRLRYKSAGDDEDSEQCTNYDNLRKKVNYLHLMYGNVKGRNHLTDTLHTTKKENGEISISRNTSQGPIVYKTFHSDTKDVSHHVDDEGISSIHEGSFY